VAETTDPAALIAVDLPVRIDHGLHDRLKAVGLPVHDTTPLYLIKPQRDLTWVTTETGDLRCGPRDVIVYDPRTDKVTVMDEIVAGGRYQPIATEAKAEPVPPPSDEPAIVPTGAGVD
jgi:hypothetical protein